MLKGSIDLNKIDKERIVMHDKNGNRFSNGAKYLPIVLWLNDEVDRYGNIASIQEDITKEEREKGVKATYLGNLKNIDGQNLSQNTEKHAGDEFLDISDDHLDDLPF